jgi:hypothetical protein
VKAPRLLDTCVKAALVLWLLLLLPICLLGIAASGATLSNPEGGPRVAAIFAAHIIATIGSFCLLAMFRRRYWPWGVAMASGSWMPAAIYLNQLTGSPNG